MPASDRRITDADIVPDEVFAGERKSRRAALLPVKKLRRVAVGPYCTFYFENFDTMLLQVQEMLYIERGGAEQLADELAAYNPLIPQGSELVATVMFEIDDPTLRASILGRLGGVEDHMFIQLGEHRVSGVAEGDVERTRDDGKASSVHFLHFPFTAEQIGAFKDASITAMAGVDHAHYGHLAVLSAETRAELAKDFA